jgi:hypothetical protein
MKIGFKKADVRKGGQYEELFYNHVVVEGREIEIVKSYLTISVDEEEIGYAWLVANAVNLGWEDVSIYVEAPASFKTVKVPNWLPDNTYQDEDDNQVDHTFESWGGVVRETLDDTKILLKVTSRGDLSKTQLDSLNSLVSGNPSLTALLVEEARTLVAGVDYVVPE